MKRIKQEYVVQPVGFSDTSFSIRKSGDRLDNAEFMRDSRLLKYLFGGQSGVLKVTYEVTTMTEIARKLGGTNERQ